MSEPWTWTKDVVEAAVNHARAGRSLAPAAWPGGARAAVALSFDSDHETLTLRNADTRPGRLSQGEYGARVAVPRILALLARYDIPASFFMPAMCAMLRPAEVRDYVERGHEVALHGWIHERNNELPAAVERDLTLRAADTLEKIAGVRPVGIRTPSWDFSHATLGIIRELGLAYDSSLMADDDPYEIVADGTPTGIVEIPVEWIRDDAPWLPMDPARTLVPPHEVGRIWRDEFDAAYEAGGLFQLTLHPHVIGHRSRLGMLTDLVDHIAGHPAVWFATHAQVAQHVLPAP
jgi:peptidoglycan-N-acetylglucosamine deacetylase